jgi:hypothetical protein
MQWKDVPLFMIILSLHLFLSLEGDLRNRITIGLQILQVKLNTTTIENTLSRWETCNKYYLQEQDDQTAKIQFLLRQCEKSMIEMHRRRCVARQPIVMNDCVDELLVWSRVKIEKSSPLWGVNTVDFILCNTLYEFFKHCTRRTDTLD